MEGLTRGGLDGGRYCQGRERLMGFEEQKKNGLVWWGFIEGTRTQTRRPGEKKRVQVSAEFWD